MNSSVEFSLPHQRGWFLFKKDASEPLCRRYFRLQDGALYVSRSKKQAPDHTFHLCGMTVDWKNSHTIKVFVKNTSKHFEFKCQDLNNATQWYAAMKQSSSWKLRSFYKVGILLGSGSYGRVFAAERTLNGMRVAIKVIPRDDFDNFNEILIPLKLDHPNVIRAIDVLHTSSRVYIVFQQMDQNLGEWIRKRGALNENDAREVIRQLLSGLKYLQKKGIIHRDLKPENVLVKKTEDGFELKIADFGLSKILKDSETSVKSQYLETTPAYASPEQILRQRYSFGIDLWACGVTMYKMLIGKHPFMHGDPDDALRNARKGRYTLDDPHMIEISSDARSLLSKFLEVNPEKRISLRDAAKHPWLSQ